jgi:peptidoglycan/LPS O-acetylase OafA/YrhL
VRRQTAVRCGLAGVAVMTVMAYISNHAGGHLGVPGNLRGGLYMGGLISAMFLLLWANSDHEHGTGPMGRFLIRLGQWSYSTYLWHFTVMTFVAIPISARLTAALGLSVWPHLLIGLIITAAITAPLSYLSFRWIEVPFLQLRPRYVVATSQTFAAPHGHR